MNWYYQLTDGKLYHLDNIKEQDIEEVMIWLGRMNEQAAFDKRYQKVINKK